MEADTKAGQLRDGMRNLIEQELMARVKEQRKAAAPASAVAVAKPAPVDSAPAADRRLEADVERLAIVALGVPAERFDLQENLANYGVDSIAITELMAQISRFFGISIAPTTFFEAKHLNELCAILRARHGKAIAARYDTAPAAVPTPVARPTPPRASREPVAASPSPAPIDAWLKTLGVRRAAPPETPPRPMAREITQATSPSNEAVPVAIIAMAGKFPRSPDLEAFRAHLRQGDDCIEEIPAERWDWRSVWGDPKKGAFCDVKYGGFIPEHDRFDADFFNISPKEAELMDPQHRLFIECVWQLIERAGYAPGALAGRKIGMFLGINLQDYVDLANRQGLMEAVQMTGLGHIFCPNRLSFLLDVHGPSEVIDTACSSSLVAVHRALMSIRHEGCEMAVAGGSNLMLTPTQHIMFSKVGMLSQDGRCKTFSDRANGYVRADGVGAVLLKRLDLAERDGDRILAVIRGSAVNHGGAASSLTAPNPQAQARLIVEAHRQAGVDPRSITLIECHGTGTRLGDPIEVEGLKTAFAELYRERGLDQPAQAYCGLGSAKSNIGHAETAAGIAGLIKLVLAMQDGVRYRSLHCAVPNPLIELDGTPFELLVEARPWTRPLIDGVEQPRRAGISSFGAGGANAHLVLEEYRAASLAQPTLSGPAVVPLSARNESALKAAAQALHTWLLDHAPVSPAQFASLVFTLQTGRDALNARFACLASDGAQLAEQLAALLGDTAGTKFPGRVFQGQKPRGRTAEALDPRTQTAAEVAARWVAGTPVEWMVAWPESQPRRLELPTYPFQGQRFWLPEPEVPEGVTLIQDGADGFTVALTGHEHFLADHRVQGTPVLPGVMYLELVRRAAEAKGLKDFCIRQTIWHKPLLVAAPVALDIRLQPDASGWPRVEIASLSGDGGRQVHAQARLAARDVGPRPALSSIEALRVVHPQAFEQERVYQAFAAIGIDYGPAHRALRSLYLGVDERGSPQVLAELRLPEAMTGELNVFGLHPSLLDGAFQATIGMTLGDSSGPGTALPFALDRVEIHGPCTARMWAHVRHGQAQAIGTVRALDIDLLDETGQLRVSLHGFSTRLLKAVGGRGNSDVTLIYACGWQTVPAVSDDGTATSFARRIVFLGGPAPHIPSGWECLSLPDPADYSAAARHILQFLQTWVAGAPRPASPVLLQLLLQGEQAETLAGLAGMLKTAHLEYPWLWCQTLLLDAGVVAAPVLELAAAMPQLAELRLREGRLEMPCWREHAVLATLTSAPWRADGVYLITGGAGALGRLLAREIFRQAPGASIILAGRAAAEGEFAVWLAHQKSAGARLAYRALDVTDEAAATELVAAIRREHGHLHGVIHAAGVIQDRALLDKTAQELDRVLAPKVRGALNLDLAIGNGALDFLVLFSSLSGVFGNPGQVDYAAANAFLDSFAEAREARRARGLCQGRTLSIAWPLWREGGMAMDSAVIRLMRQTTGLGELATDAGMAALTQALTGLSGRVLVVTGDAARVRQRINSVNQPEALPLPARRSAISAVRAADLEPPLLAVLMRSVSAQLKVALNDLDPDVELPEYGFDSISFTQFANDLNERFGLDIAPTLFFEYPTLGVLAARLAAEHGTLIGARLGVAPAPVPEPAVVAVPAPAAEPVAQPESIHATVPDSGLQPIAIISVSGIFPEARDPEQFWRNLEEGRDCIGEIPAERWDWRAWWGDPAKEANRCNVKWGGFIEGMGEFDPAFFGLSGPEARAMDPQQRLLLTEAWRLIERAGYAPRSLAGSRTGVFIGTADTGYGRLAAATGMGVEGYSMTGLAPSLGPNRISYFFNFHGPSVAVETACSSALVAIHRAVEAIHGGSCESAIAGGINALLLPEAFVGFSKAGMLAPDGRCKSFSAEANGYARGEGLGLVFLKPLAAAERDGDRILGVIRASMENHGGRASSLTAPNPRAQADLLRRAWRRAGIDPRTVGYIEAHGTGTPLGDPIEMEALSAAFADLDLEAEAQYGPQPTIPCGIGSVKSNIGHLELAAGAAGLTKVLLQMAHGTLVRTLHCDTLNPYLKLSDSRFQVVRENQPWPRPRDATGRELPRRAGVSGFGFGGSNAHLVIEEYLAPTAVAAVLPAGPAMIVLSARTVEQLLASARQLAAAIGTDMPLAEIAWTLQFGRDAMEHRLAFLASSHAQLREALLAVAEGREDDLERIHRGQVKAHRDTLAILDGDEEMRRAVASLPARGKHDSLLQLWVRGLVVDWRSLYPGACPPRRLLLPCYPFARTRYWVGEATGRQVEAAAALPLPQVAQQVEIQTVVAEAVIPQAAPVDRVARALAALVGIAARVLEVDPTALEPDTELGEYGFDSITMTGFASKANDELGLSLTPADFFEFATLRRLARHIADTPAFDCDEEAPATPSSAMLSDGTASQTRASASPSPRAIAASVAVAQRSVAVTDEASDPVAIVGVSCRFPMAADVEAFWQNLLDGRDCIRDIPADRWDWREVYGDPKREPTKTNIRWAGFIDGVFEFDPLFFGISPREAKLMDPQQRLLMMHVWKAIEDSGHNPRSFAGQAVGLFVATSSSGYREMIGADTGGEGYVATGAVPSVGPNRVSYFLDWHGPSEPVETACSSSLVALHRAIQAMRSGDCDMAVVGGVNTIVTPEAHINFAKAGMLSPGGRCKTFSAQADGYARGEGIGMIVLRRLSEARRDGDHVYAVVRGSAINHGGRANSLTAPNTAAQADVLKAAYDRSGIDVASVGYIEAHGTGTPLGDPVEINALKSAFRDLGVVAGPTASCGIGAVKTNIGHLELAAGMAGIVKVLLQMRHRTLVRSLHSEELNPYIDLNASPFFIVGKNQPWPAPRDAAGRELPRRAGISSFGFGGVNAHVVLEEYPTSALQPEPAQPVLVPLSARGEERLRDQVRQLLAALATGRYQAAELPDLAWTLQVGREAMKYRLAVVVSSLAELGRELQAWLDGLVGSVVSGRVEAGQAPVSGALPELARQWVKGAEVAWPARPLGRRLSLPTYPFSRDEYRIGSPATSHTTLPASACGMHLGGDGAVLCTLNAGAFYLRDHRVQGAMVLPGAMSVELARMAQALVSGQAEATPALSLEQVVWLQPLTAAEGSVKVRIELAPGDEPRVFLLSSGDVPGGTLHVKGRVGPLTIPEAPARMDRAEIARRCPNSLGRDWLYSRYAALGLDYGSAFRVVAALQAGQDECLARLELPPAAIGSERFGIHPVILDGAFQSCLGLFAAVVEEGQAALPFVMEAVHFHRPTSDTMWVHGRLLPGSGGVRKIDLDLADENGRICVQVRGFSVRLLTPRPTKAAPVAPQAIAQGALASEARRYLAALVAAEASVTVDRIDTWEALEAYGIDSIMITRLTDRLEQDFGQLSRTLFFDYQTIDALAAHFVTTHGERLAALTGLANDRAPAPKIVATAAQNVGGADGGIAIIGLAGRYPGARNLEEFWNNLAAGRDSVGEVPASRWDHSRYYDPVRGKPGKTNSKWGGFIEDFDCFDPLFFNISPREAAYLDPQERLFLQCAWETLEDAGYTRAALARSEPPLGGASVGVFVGVMYEEYQLYGAESTLQGEPLALGGSASSIANRVSYFCNLHGPSLAVDSMCSSSLSAIHLACDSLRSGSCRMALAGGVNLTVHPNKYLALSQGRFTSSKGRCESFGEGGDGYVPAEGVGAVLLKPLAQAEADGDRIYGVIRSSALNHGGKTNGYAVPNPHAQAAVISRALALAGIDPRAISYLEAHGTGTSLGDPIEIAALSRAFGAHTDARGFCAIGSVKSNIGHAESASGIAGLSKLLLQMQHGQLVPSLHSEHLNPGIDFAATPFVVQQRLQPWQQPVLDTPRGRETAPRIAGLSSFGAGGANAHLVIEEYIPAEQAGATPFTSANPGVFPFSARDGERLREMLQRMHRSMATLHERDLPSLAHGLQTGREAFESRVVLLAAERLSLLGGLERLLAGNGDLGGMHACDKVVQGQAEQLAREWARGGKVDWLQLWPGAAPRRIAMPTYPFARQRCWLPRKAESAARIESGSAALAVDVARLGVPTLPLLFAPDWQPQAPGSAGAPAARGVVVLCEPVAWDGERDAAILAPSECRLLDLRPAPIHERYTSYAQELLGMIQALVRERTASALLQIVVPGAGEGLLFEGLAGLLRTAHLENPVLRCQLLAVQGDVADLPALLRSEAASRDLQVRYRGAQRQVRQWRELLAPVVASGTQLWRDEGVYLITGGGGGLGLLLAEEIARQARDTRLYLVGRSPLSADVEARLAILPAQVQFRRADINQESAVVALVEELQASHGRINGIVHAAGLNRDRLLLRKSQEEMASVLAPKVTGLFHLDRASAACELDFMLLFASASGALGNPGQADYACANGWMDAFAAYRNGLRDQGQRHGRTLAIDWPYWREGGMRLEAGQIQAMTTATGLVPLITERGMACLELAWGTELEQILVLDGEPERVRGLLGTPGQTTGGLTAAGQTATVPAGPSVGDVLAPGLKQKTVVWLSRELAEVLGMPPFEIDAQQTVDRYGIDSVLAMQVIEALERDLGPLPKTLLFEYPSMALLADALIVSHGTALATLGFEPDPDPDPPGSGPGGKALEQAQATAPDVVSSSDVAVLAVAGRYPGADTMEAFWELLQAGRDCVTEVPGERWDHAQVYSPEKGKPASSNCRWGGFLSDVDCFDPGFFGLSPRDAMLMDPQERLFLQTVWHVLERGGHTRELLRERYAARVGVYVGAMYSPYHAVETDADSRALVSLSSHASMANRVSFFFDLQGPSVAVDTMCSSALHAVHLAVQSLQRGECALAIAGGVNLSLHAGKYVGLARAGMLGSHAGSRSFANGDGYLPAEGVGAVLLKPLSDAIRDKDPILAVIKASAVNHGGHSAGYGVPSGEAQARLIEDNFRRSGIDPLSIGYVEAAATGAALADAIEFRALTRAFRKFTAAEGFCGIGSVKSNMGHGESASGMAQLTKVLLQLEHGQLVPGVMAEPLNPQLQFHGSPFRPQQRLEPWQRARIDGVEQPRRASVSSFGAGGANVHLILEEAPAFSSVEAVGGAMQRFPFSARDPERLAELLESMSDYLLGHPNLSMARLAATLQYRREPMACACEFVAADRADLLAQLAGAPGEHSREVVVPADATLAPLVLPGYPFARERYWLPAPVPSPVAAKEGDAASGFGEVAGPSEIVERIREILATELRLSPDQVKEDTAFRTLGADSMAGLRLIYGVAEATGVQLLHGDLERFPTPLALAAEVRARSSADSPAPAKMDSGVAASCALSEGQKGLWLWQRLYPDSSAYNVPLAFWVEGLDLPLLEQACRAMLGAWPLLARRIEMEEGAEARWLAKAQVEEELLTLLPLPVGERLEEFVRTRARIAFDLAAARPIRFELLRGEQDVLLILVHHIVFDGLSALHFARHFWHCYRALAAGEPLPAPPEAAAFEDFVAWEQGHLRSDAGQADLTYWQAQLAGELPVLSFPSDRRPEPGQALRGCSLERRLPDEVCRAARACAQDMGIHLSAFFLGALQILLYRYTGQQDILVGMPTLGRPSRRFEQAVGYFANLLAIRCALRGDLAAADFLRSVQTRLTAGMDHGAWPFANLCRQLGGQPRIEVLYSWQNFLAPQDLDAIAGIPVKHLSELRQEGDVPLALEIYPEGEGLQLVAGFDLGRFEVSSIERLLDHYQQLIVSICAEVATPLGRLEMLAGDERHKLLFDWNPALPPSLEEGTVVDWIARQAERSPAATALLVGSRSLSYRDLLEQARGLAAHLESWGVGPGQPVGVLLERGADSIVALLAVLQVGAIWVPLDTDYPDQRLAMILQDASVALVIAEAATRGRLPAEAVPILLLERARKDYGGYAVPRPKTAIDADSPAYMIYTSGSTGRPKGVVVSHRALAIHCAAVIEHYRLAPQDRVLQFASLHVDAALEQILPTLACGAAFLMREKEIWTPQTLAALFVQHGVSVADLPPAYLRDVLLAWAKEPVPVPCPRLLIVGGEALTPELVRLWQDGPLAGARLLNAYGPTETTVTATVHEVSSIDSNGPLPIGRPLPGGRVYILDRDGNPVPEGVPGELVIGGERVALGYRGYPELTVASFLPDPFVADPAGTGRARMYRSGDLASFIRGGNGTIAFHGRRDHQVKIRGFRIELGEIEAALRGAGLKDALVVVRSRENGDPFLVAYAVAAGRPDEIAVRRNLAERLPPPMLPAVYVFLDALPTTPGGKLDRAALPLPGLVSGGGAELSDATEIKLAGIWRELLDLENVARGDDFFLCGGHSLLALALLGAIRSAFGRQLSMVALLAAPTLGQQAQLLRGEAVAAEASVLVPLREGEGIPLFCVHPVGGGVGCYRELARYLGGGRPIFGLQSPTLDGAAPAANLRTMATGLLAAVRAAQPTGPYYLAGWSLGGTLAYEMAQQLAQAGERVKMLALIDCYAPALLAALHEGENESLRLTFSRDYNALAGPGVSLPADQEERLFRIFQAHASVLQAYRPEPYAGPAILFAATEPQNAETSRGWGGLVQGGLSVIGLPGDHYSLLQVPQVSLLAEHLRGAMDDGRVFAK